jgi:predicted dehydrogenase
MIGVGVIGLGRLGTKHAEIFAGMPHVRLSAVADSDPQRCKDSMARFQVDGYSRAKDLCARTDLDAVSICTPDWAHLVPALAAISSGKHVFIEKPLADSEPDACKIVRTARTAKVKLMVGHLLRFDPRYGQARTAIEHNTIGEVVHVSAKRNSYIDGPLYYGGRYSLPFHLAIHEIDLLKWIIDSPVVRVYAESAAKALADNGMDDTLFTLLRFANGAIASLEHCWVLCAGCGAETLGPQMEIVGTKGSIYIAGNGGIEICRPEGSTLPDLGILGKLPTGALTGCLPSVLESFIECVVHDTEPPITGEDGLSAVRVASAVTRSLDIRGPVSMGRSIL